MSSSELEEAFEKTRPAKTKKREVLYNAASTPGRRGKRGITYYVTPAVLEDLKSIADEMSVEKDRDVKLKDVVQIALNDILARYGKEASA